MSLFDDIVGKITDLTGAGQDIADQVGQVKEDATGQVEEHVSGVTEQLPQDPADVAGQIFGDNNEK